MSEVFLGFDPGAKRGFGVALLRGLADVYDRDALA
jgi:hypothetical protein